MKMAGRSSRVDNAAEGMYIGDFRRIYNDPDFVNQVYKKFNRNQDGYLTVEEYETAADLYPPFKILKTTFEDIARKRVKGLPAADKNMFKVGMRQVLSPNTHFVDADARELERLFERHVEDQVEDENGKVHSVVNFIGFFNAVRDRGPLRDKIHKAMALKPYVSDNIPLMVLFGEEDHRNIKRRRGSSTKERGVADWEPMDVQGYFDTLRRAPFDQLRRYANRFLEQNINGKQLLKLTSNQLQKDLRITNKEHIDLFMTHRKNMQSLRHSLTIKVEMAARFKRPIAVEVYDKDTIMTVKENLEDIIDNDLEDRHHGPKENLDPDDYVLMANSKRLMDNKKLKDQGIIDGQSVYLIDIRTPMARWNKYQVYVWIKAHDELKEYAKSFYNASIDGQRLEELGGKAHSNKWYVGQHTMVENFVNENGDSIKVGQRKDLLLQIRKAVKAQAKMESGRLMSSKASDDAKAGTKPSEVSKSRARGRATDVAATGAGGGKADSDKMQNWVLKGLLFAVFAALACKAGILGSTCQANLAAIIRPGATQPASAPQLFATSHPIHKDGTPHFVNVGIGQCLTSSGRKPRYHWTPMQGARRKLADCQQSCTDLPGCTGIAYQSAKTDRDSAICAVYHGSMGAGPADWNGPHNPDYPGVPLDSTKTDKDKNYNCFRLEHRKPIRDKEEQIQKLENLEASVKEELSKPEIIREDETTEQVKEEVPGAQNEDDWTVVNIRTADGTETATLRLNIPFPKSDDEMASLRKRIQEELIRETGEPIEIMNVVDGSTP